MKATLSKLENDINAVQSLKSMMDKDINMKFVIWYSLQYKEMAVAFCMTVSFKWLENTKICEKNQLSFIATMSQITQHSH